MHVAVSPPTAASDGGKLHTRPPPTTTMTIWTYELTIVQVLAPNHILQVRAAMCLASRYRRTRTGHNDGH
jgi:hypothetical protein